MKKLYRCGFKVMNAGEAETYESQIIGITFEEYSVIKETDKTYTIQIKDRLGNHTTSIVLKDQSGKRFAYETKERALEAFIIRRKSHRQWLLTKMENNDRLIEVAKNTVV